MTTATANPDPKTAIRAKALEIGFDAVGFAPANMSADARGNLHRYLARGYHGDMGWLADTAERRGHPQSLWPEARSVVVVAQNYGPAEDPMLLLEHPTRGLISLYARNRDYHDLLKKRLKQLARWMHATWERPVKVFVDTAPVMEKPLAERAGLGWQGKHTNLVSRDWGSWLFLGEVFTELALEPDEAGQDYCGTCRRCLDVCPTDAFPAPYQLDATRCISYLTIEHKGHIPRALRAAIGNRIYGCDDCLAVCPWNKFARPTREEQFFGRIELTAPRLKDLAELDDAGFRRLFSGSAIKRLGRDRFVRNVLIAIGNSGEPRLIETLRTRLDDTSPLVRAAALWALARLAPPDLVRKEAGARLPRESDPDVQAEWRTELEEIGTPA